MPHHIEVATEQNLDMTTESPKSEQPTPDPNHPVEPPVGFCQNVRARWTDLKKHPVHLIRVLTTFSTWICSTVVMGLSIYVFYTLDISLEDVPWNSLGLSQNTLVLPPHAPGAPSLFAPFSPQRPSAALTITSLTALYTVVLPIISSWWSCVDSFLCIRPKRRPVVSLCAAVILFPAWLVQWGFWFVCDIHSASDPKWTKEDAKREYGKCKQPLLREDTPVGFGIVYAMAMFSTLIWML